MARSCSLAHSFYFVFINQINLRQWEITAQLNVSKYSYVMHIASNSHCFLSMDPIEFHSQLGILLLQLRSNQKVSWKVNKMEWNTRTRNYWDEELFTQWKKEKISVNWSDAYIQMQLALTLNAHFFSYFSQRARADASVQNCWYGNKIVCMHCMN
jgi:hypothetical protein